MACMAVFLTPIAMATTQLTRATHSETAVPWNPEECTIPARVRMSWVVVTDNDGSRRLRAKWLPVDSD